MLLVEREVGEGYAAGRERRYWVGESEGGSALLGGKEVTTVDCWMALLGTA
jgi:hypothetical protein